MHLLIFSRKYITAFLIAVVMCFGISFIAPAHKAEAQSQGELIELINQLLATIASLQSQIAAQEGGAPSSGAEQESGSSDSVTHTSVVEEGVEVEVSDRLSVRRSPAGSLVGIVEKGTEGEVIDGPRIVDGRYWWKIRYSTGLSGWSAGDWLKRMSTYTPQVAIVDEVKETEEEVESKDIVERGRITVYKNDSLFRKLNNYRFTEREEKCLQRIKSDLNADWECYWNDDLYMNHVAGKDAPANYDAILTEKYECSERQRLCAKLGGSSRLVRISDVTILSQLSTDSAGNTNGQVLYDFNFTLETRDDYPLYIKQDSFVAHGSVGEKADFMEAAEESIRGLDASAETIKIDGETYFVLQPDKKERFAFALKYDPVVENRYIGTFYGFSFRYGGSELYRIDFYPNRPTSQFVRVSGISAAEWRGDEIEEEPSSVDSVADSSTGQLVIDGTDGLAMESFEKTATLQRQARELMDLIKLPHKVYTDSELASMSRAQLQSYINTLLAEYAEQNKSDATEDSNANFTEDDNEPTINVTVTPTSYTVGDSTRPKIHWYSSNADRVELKYPNGDVKSRSISGNEYAQPGYLAVTGQYDWQVRSCDDEGCSKWESATLKVSKAETSTNNNAVSVAAGGPYAHYVGTLGQFGMDVRDISVRINSVNEGDYLLLSSYTPVNWKLSGTDVGKLQKIVVATENPSSAGNTTITGASGVSVTPINGGGAPRYTNNSNKKSATDYLEANHASESLSKGFYYYQEWNLSSVTVNAPQVQGVSTSNQAAQLYAVLKSLKETLAAVK